MEVCAITLRRKSHCFAISNLSGQQALAPEAIAIAQRFQCWEKLEIEPRQGETPEALTQIRRAGEAREGQIESAE